MFRVSEFLAACLILKFHDETFPENESPIRDTVKPPPLVNTQNVEPRWSLQEMVAYESLDRTVPSQNFVSLACDGNCIDLPHVLNVLFM